MTAPRARCLHSPPGRTCIAWRGEGETMRRRGFLARAAVLGAAPLLTKCRAHDAAASKAPADLSDWEKVRGQFSLDPAWVHMSMFFLASHPTTVKEAIEAHWRGLAENRPDGGVAGRRRVHRRLPQVDLRTSRDRADLGERRRMGGHGPDHSDLRRDVAGRSPGPHAEGRADDATPSSIAGRSSRLSASTSPSA